MLEIYGPLGLWGSSCEPPETPLGTGLIWLGTPSKIISTGTPLCSASLLLTYLADQNSYPDEPGCLLQGSGWPPPQPPWLCPMSMPRGGHFMYYRAFHVFETKT